MEEQLSPVKGCVLAGLCALHGPFLHLGLLPPLPLSLSQLSVGKRGDSEVCFSSSPSSATSAFCDFGQIPHLYWAVAFSSVKWGITIVLTAQSGCEEELEWWPSTQASLK